MLKTEAEVLQAKETRDRLQANKVSLFIGSVVFSSTPPDNPNHTMVRGDGCCFTYYYQTIPYLFHTHYMR